MILLLGSILKDLDYHLRNNPRSSHPGVRVLANSTEDSIVSAAASSPLLLTNSRLLACNQKPI